MDCAIQRVSLWSKNNFDENLLTDLKNLFSVVFAMQRSIKCHLNFSRQCYLWLRTRGRDLEIICKNHYFKIKIHESKCSLKIFFSLSDFTWINQNIFLRKFHTTKYVFCYFFTQFNIPLINKEFNLLHDTNKIEIQVGV